MKRLLLVGTVLIMAACGFAAVPPAGHVFVVLEENHSYSSVIGSSSMPYLNGLAKQYSMATAYYANTHPSIGNYLMLTTGQIITNSDGYTSTVTADNIVRHFLTSAKTWKSYAESLPYAGYLGGDTGNYVKHHNPFAYFSDVRNSSVQKMNLVPFTQFATDLVDGSLPQFSFIVPNLNDDAHNGTLATADNWLKSHIAPLIASPTFQKDGLLLIVFDESYSSDTAFGGGHVAMVAVGPAVQNGYRSTLHYQHQSLLKTVMESLGLTTFPGAASTAPAMSDVFKTSAATCSATGTMPSVTICSPAATSNLSSPVQVQAATASSSPITNLAIYLDYQKVYDTQTGVLDTSLTITSGTHRLVVQAWDSAGEIFKAVKYITVN